ncbi:MAG: Phosphoglycerate mutase family protein [Parcubacteria group bacterium GW2011_GWA2_47_12]|nr:MAG: Phosphoglycerate mutase family protein [Parcubacteria group bacterium GW2011_GWA2_47_12]
MKKVYFIRHGESEGNAGPIRQGRSSSLTQKGLEQSEIIAERCEKLSIDSIISSTMKRAVETAKIILARLKKPVEYSDLFAERRRPKEQIGVLKSDRTALDAEKTIRENFTVSGFRFSDEENFDDLKTRAGQVLRYLQKKPEKNILVVTHGFF